MNLFSETNKIFWTKYPELEGRKLNDSPEDAEYRKEYMKIMRTLKKPQSVTNKKISDPIGSCPNDKNNEVKNKVENEECKIEKIKIQKGDNGYELIVGESAFSYDDINYENVNFLEIVSGPKSKKSEINMNSIGLVGPCNEKHTGKTFQFNDKDFEIVSKTDSQLKIRVFSVDIKKEKDTGMHNKLAIAATENNRFYLFYKIVDAFFNKEDYCIPHTITYAICGMNKQIKLRVYPHLKLSASIGYKLEAAGSGDRQKFLPKRENVNDNGFHYEFKIDHDGIELIKLEQKTETTYANKDAFKYTENDEFSIDSFNYRFKLAQNAFKDSCATLISDKSEDIKISFNPKINAECEFVEIPGTSLVGKKYSIDIGMDPLFGVEAKIDISGKTLLLIPPPVGPFLVASIKTLEYFDFAELFLGFVVSGEISLKGKIDNFITCKNPLKVNIEAKGSIKIRLEGKVTSERHFWKLNYSIGAKAGAASGVEVEESELTEDNDGLFFPIELTFLGVTIYGQTWANTGASIESSNVPDFAKLETKQSLDAIGNSESEEIDDLKDAEKKVIIKESIILNEKFYLLKSKK